MAFSCKPDKAPRPTETAQDLKLIQTSKLRRMGHTIVGSSLYSTETSCRVLVCLHTPELIQETLEEQKKNRGFILHCPDM